MPYVNRYRRKYYRRYGYRRKYGSNRLYRSKFKAKRKGKGENGVRYFKLQIVNDLSSDGTGVLSFHKLVNEGVQTTTDWTSVSGLFDQYRVCAIKWKYIPARFNDTTAQTMFPPAYIVYDQTTLNSNPITSVDVALGYENVKVVNMGEQWKVYRRIPKLSSSQVQAAVYQGGWLNIEEAGDYQEGSIGIYGTGFSTSVTYGKLISIFYVKCRGRK